MIYRPCPDLPPPFDVDLDTAETVEAAAAIARGERHLRMLAELAEIAMNLARSLGELSQARIEEVKSTDAVLSPGEDPAAAFSKISQTLRRTIDLEARLADRLQARGQGLVAAQSARSARRAALTETHRRAVNARIEGAISDAFFDTDPKRDVRELQNVLNAMENYRSEYDEFRDYLKRPIGETVAGLCALLKLDPTSCIKQGETWMVRRRDLEHEAIRNPIFGAPIWPTPTDPPP